jgi:hypothetical protein
MPDCRSVRALTARLWLATHGDQPLELPPGCYATAGRKLWRVDGEEGEAARSVEGDSTAGSRHENGLGLGGPHARSGDSGGGGRGDGVRQVPEGSGGGNARWQSPKHRASLPELPGVQRDARSEQRIKRVQDLKYGIADQRQRFSDRHPIAQRWEAGEIALHLQLTLGAEHGNKGNTPEWCADLQRTSSFDELVYPLYGPIGELMTFPARSSSARGPSA